MPLGAASRMMTSRSPTPCKRFGAHRPRRREQEALAEADIVIEQIDHHRFGLDPFGDQADAEAAEQIGQIGGMNVGRRAPPC